MRGENRWRGLKFRSSRRRGKTRLSFRSSRVSSELEVVLISRQRGWGPSRNVESLTNIGERMGFLRGSNSTSDLTSIQYQLRSWLQWRLSQKFKGREVNCGVDGVKRIKLFISTRWHRELVVDDESFTSSCCQRFDDSTPIYSARRSSHSIV